MSGTWADILRASDRVIVGWESPSGYKQVEGTVDGWTGDGDGVEDIGVWYVEECDCRRPCCSGSFKQAQWGLSTSDIESVSFPDEPNAWFPVEDEAVLEEVRARV